MIPLIEIVPGAEELDVDGHQGCSPFGPGENVVEMKVILGAAFGALTLVALPDGLFD